MHHSAVMSMAAEQAIKGMEERAAARYAAALELDRLSREANDGLVKEELCKGVARMLIQQTEYLLHASKIRKEHSL